ncbi:hypothetical protein [Haloferula sp. BvORR071]|uniref:hypothetical protein n=1 Tax=Haloferula sp. BvORR071 TaxID=1396141 RepID=UPI0005541CE5|nr:hypothetical protein [Haloferula sp. BvORR071]
MSLWLGLPVLIFFLWAWRDSMVHSFAFNLKHGKTFVMAWPPLERMPSPATPSVPLAYEPNLDLPSLDVPAWEEFGKEVAYFNSSIPEDKRMPLAPHRPLELRPDDLYRNSNRTAMQPYLGLGSAEGVVWFSSWIAPDFPKTPEWTYLHKFSGAPWFAALEWTHNEQFQIHSLRIPYWAIVSAYTLGWFAFLAWRRRRLRKQLSLMSQDAPSS